MTVALVDSLSRDARMRRSSLESPTTMTLQTERLELRPLAPQHLLALIEGEAQFASSFGTPAPDGLRGFMVSDGVSPEWLAKLRTSTTADAWTHGFAMIHRDLDVVIGMVGFKGPPDEQGVVEVSYGVLPGFEGQGFSTEAAGAATDWAFASGIVRTVRAHTLPEPNASARVLQKSGFRFIGDVIDPEDGPVWRWERDAVLVQD